MQSAVVSWYLLPDRNPSIDRRSMFSGGNSWSRSGRELLALVDAPCFLQIIVLLGAWALIMGGFEATAYTTQSQGLCVCILWLMNLLLNTLLTTQSVKYLWSFVRLFGSFRACVDALTRDWSCIQVFVQRYIQHSGSLVILYYFLISPIVVQVFTLAVHTAHVMELECEMSGLFTQFLPY